MKIDQIEPSAPLFKGATDQELTAVIDHLKQASVHYADNSGTEWGLAQKQLRAAAEILDKTGLCYRAIYSLHKEASPIMPVGDVIDAVFACARKKDTKEVTP